MLPLILSALSPLFGKMINTVGEKLGVDMDSDDLKMKKLEIEAELNKSLLQVDLKQLEINLAEANNVNRRWPTWRECLGYTCVAAVAYHFVIQQFLAFFLTTIGKPIQLPVLDMSGLLTILSAMLGVHFVDSRYNSPQDEDPEKK